VGYRLRKGTCWTTPKGGTNEKSIRSIGSLQETLSEALTGKDRVFGEEINYL